MTHSYSSCDLLVFSNFHVVTWNAGGPRCFFVLLGCDLAGGDIHRPCADDALIRDMHPSSPNKMPDPLVRGHIEDSCRTFCRPMAGRFHRFHPPELKPSNKRWVSGVTVFPKKPHQLHGGCFMKGVDGLRLNGERPKKMVTIRLYVWLC